MGDMRADFIAAGERLITVHGAEDFDGMRKAGRLGAETLDFITPHVKPGVTTEELDRLCDEFTLSHGAVSAPLGYRGFPKSICTSVNHVVCHGIPGKKRLADGDILNIDVTVILDGWHGDTSRMFFLGDISVKARRLVDVTYQAMWRGIKVVRPGRRWAISDTPSRISSNPSASRWCGTSAATAWGRCSTKPPTSCISASPAKAQS